MGRVIRSLVIIGVLGNWLCARGSATPPAPIKIFYLGVDSPDLKVNSEIELRLVFHEPPRKERPKLTLQIDLPEQSKIVYTSFGEAKKSEDGQAIVWKGTPKEDGETQRIKFKITKAGFFKIHGNVRLDEQSPEIVESVKPHLGFMPESYYVRVSENGGRVEEWDFSSVGKRFKHWFKGNKRPQH